MLTMKKYVGTANIFPDSRTPRRLPYAMTSDECDRDRQHDGPGARRPTRGRGPRRPTRQRSALVGQQRDAGDLRGDEAELSRVTM